MNNHTNDWSLFLQVPYISSRTTPTGSSHFQGPRRRKDTHDPRLQTGWTVLTPPHPHLWPMTSHCLCHRLQEDRSSGSNGRGRKRRTQQKGEGTRRRTDTKENIKTNKTEVHTSGPSALAKMALLVATQRLLLLPCCWPCGHYSIFKEKLVVLSVWTFIYQLSLVHAHVASQGEVRLAKLSTDRKQGETTWQIFIDLWDLWTSKTFL